MHHFIRENVELGTEFAYLKSLYLSPDMLPVTLSAIQNRCGGNIHDVLAFFDKLYVSSQHGYPQSVRC